MKFVDYVKIYVSAGSGGRGCVSFRREKYIPRGGPNGGDGGKGADIIFRADSRLNTLLDHAYCKHYHGQRGGHGMGRDMHGENGQDLVVLVPVGTVIKRQETEEVLADIDKDGMEAVIARGGRGGKGNAHFKSSTMRSPRFAQPGEEGEEAYLILELKLLADVGLIGMPNAGKSTFIASVSAARPKIADYPFTTLVPNLGVVKMGDYTSFTMADIPGIIENAHKGAGLGLNFLRHAQRTCILLHLVDISDSLEADPVDIFEKIEKELILYDPLLWNREKIVVGTKKDISLSGERLARLHTYCREKGLPFHAVSAVTREGLDSLIAAISGRVTDLKRQARQEQALAG